MTGRSRRIDDGGRAGKGSQRQIQIYVNQRQEELSECVLAALLGVPTNARLKWVSPLAVCGFKEYRDIAFLRALRLDQYAGELKEFWPKGGPSWDALAIVEVGAAAGEHGGVVLVEGKSHPNELRGGGCRAVANESRDRIESALSRAACWLNVREGTEWTGKLYQSANRLAHLYFFRKVLGVPAWLVNVYFLSDPISPTTRQGWVEEIGRVRCELGLSEAGVPFSASVFLEARDWDEAADAERR